MNGCRLDGKWRCGHERTVANTAGVLQKRPGGCCRTCHLARQERYANTVNGIVSRELGLLRSHAKERGTR